jgi:predicted ATPase
VSRPDIILISNLTSLNIAVAYGFNPEGGSRNFNFTTHASHSALHQFITLGKGQRHRDGFFLRGESFFNVATNIDQLDKEPGGRKIIDSFGGVSLHEQSHGESFWALMMNRFHGNGLYILDEPEAALSPNRQMAMLTRMHELIGQDSQFVIATHPPIVMAYPDSIIYEISEAGIKRTGYTHTENYKTSYHFINNHKKWWRSYWGGIDRCNPDTVNSPLSLTRCLYPLKQGPAIFRPAASLGHKTSILPK